MSPPQTYGAPVGAGDTWSELSSIEWALNPAEEKNLCRRQTLAEDVFIGGFRAGTEVGMHHAVIFLAENPTLTPDGLATCPPFETERVMLFAAGVGTGVVVNGEVVRGHGHTAGEFGHIPISSDGPRCLCGADGCLEAHTSNLATVARYLGHELSPAFVRERLHETRLTVEDVILRARGGDQQARAALENTGRYLGLGLSTIVKALNPAQIVLGGEITGAWDIIEPAIRAEMKKGALTREAAETPVVPERAGSLPRLRGAIALVAACQVVFLQGTRKLVVQGG